MPSLTNARGRLVAAAFQERLATGQSGGRNPFLSFPFLSFSPGDVEGRMMEAEGVSNGCDWQRKAAPRVPWGAVEVGVGVWVGDLLQPAPKPPPPTAPLSILLQRRRSLEHPPAPPAPGTVHPAPSSPLPSDHMSGLEKALGGRCSGLARPSKQRVFHERLPAIIGSTRGSPTSREAFLAFQGA
jgi:hypothetical protein